MAQLWSSTAEELGPERFDAALQRVLKSSPFRPDIAEIRKAAGINAGIVDPTETAALVAFGRVIDCMRKYGPELKPIRGKMLRDRDENGLVLLKPEYEPDSPAPVFDPSAEKAIESLGFGSRAAGLESIAAHPVLPWNTARDVEDCRARGFRANLASEIEKKWCDAYARTLKGVISPALLIGTDNQGRIQRRSVMSVREFCEG